MSLAQGSPLGPYVIRTLIGQGGMGEVYRAHDPRLDRDVAVKLISGAWADDPERRARFEREARAGAALNHPNICTVHEIGEADGRLFIAMELLEGATLNECLAMGPSPMAVAEVLDIAIQIADALHAARQKHVVHRDLKSGNIVLLPRGQVKILDFGLATRCPSGPLVGVQALARSDEPSGGDAPLTDPGTVAGTAAYMSPEHAMGEEVDHRSDLFSLGVVLYELLTGRLPFTGRTAGAVVDAVLHQAAAPIPRFNNEVPDELVRVVARLLEKDRARRYQSAYDVWTDLRRIREGRSAHETEGKSIAVLPFKDLSPQHDQDYFCDGLAEDLINALTQVRDLRVAARTSSSSFKGKDAAISEIGRALNVRTLLEGSVQKSGDTLRVTAQLINIPDGYHLWSERFDRKMTDIFAVQDEISLAIVEKLKVGLLAGEREKITRRHTEDKDAYYTYIKGRYAWNRRYQGDMIKAVSWFEKAIAIDPGYALPYVGIADVFNILGMWAYVPPLAASSNSRAALVRALAIDPELGEAHCSLGFLSYTHDREYAAAEEHLRRGIELNPSNSYGHGWYAIYLAAVRRFAEARAEARRASELDPLFYLLKAIEGIVNALSGEVEQGRELLRRAIELDPSQPMSYIFLGYASLMRPRAPEIAVEMFEKAISFGLVFAVGWLGLAHAMAGRKDVALEQRDRLDRIARERYFPLSKRVVVGLAPSLKRFRSLTTRYVSPIQRGAIALGLGDLERALSEYEASFAASDYFTTLLFTSDRIDLPWINEFVAHPRYQSMLARAGLT